mmetsp:Transcript_19800/g.64363  ORF Transcript_19800/g.64363 Transcript_19800/m.64363 type:complete len:339 (-) Transcript_19800:1972-2988(-)
MAPFNRHRCVPARAPQRWPLGAQHATAGRGNVRGGDGRSGRRARVREPLPHQHRHRSQVRHAVISPALGLPHLGAAVGLAGLRHLLRARDRFPAERKAGASGRKQAAVGASVVPRNRPKMDYWMERLFSLAGVLRYGVAGHMRSGARRVLGRFLQRNAQDWACALALSEPQIRVPISHARASNPRVVRRAPDGDVRRMALLLRSRLRAGIFRTTASADPGVVAGGVGGGRELARGGGPGFHTRGRAQLCRLLPRPRMGARRHRLPQRRGLRCERWSPRSRGSGPDCTLCSRGCVRREKRRARVEGLERESRRGRRRGSGRGRGGGRSGGRRGDDRDRD